MTRTVPKPKPDSLGDGSLPGQQQLPDSDQVSVSALEVGHCPSIVKGKPLFTSYYVSKKIVVVAGYLANGGVECFGDTDGDSRYGEAGAVVMNMQILQSLWFLY